MNKLLLLLLFNNRPISLLPVLSKVNERLAHRQFVKFLDDKKNLTNEFPALPSLGTQVTSAIFHSQK